VKFLESLLHAERVIEQADLPASVDLSILRAVAAEAKASFGAFAELHVEPWIMGVIESWARSRRFPGIQLYHGGPNEYVIMFEMVLVVSDQDVIYAEGKRCSTPT